MQNFQFGATKFSYFQLNSALTVQTAKGKQIAHKRTRHFKNQ